MQLIGASGHAKVIIDILKCLKTDVGSIWDDDESMESFLGYKIAGTTRSIPESIQNETIISIGNNKVRKQIAQKIKLPYGKAIHPNATISSDAYIAAGTVAMAGVVVNPYSKIGKHCILNTNCSIDHDCTLEDFVHISPNAALAGNVEVGEGTHIGIGANIIQGIKIGKWVTVGAGAVIIKDIPDFATVVGNPGRIIKISSNHD